MDEEAAASENCVIGMDVEVHHGLQKMRTVRTAAMALQLMNDPPRSDK